MNKCHAGHKTHDRKTVKTILGDMIVYESRERKENGYCNYHDGVSETLEKTQSWDIQIHERIQSILKQAKGKDLFVDIGCHIGYFSRLASQMGFPVKGFDGDAENLDLAKHNSPDADLRLMWFNKDTKPRKWCDGCSRFKAIEVMKIDIEGEEESAINYWKEAFEQKAVKNVIMEVSPVFNGSYPALLERLRDWGYEAFELDGTPFSNDWNFAQKDLWLKL
jgi:hypothetical protein